MMRQVHKHSALIWLVIIVLAWAALFAAPKKPVSAWLYGPAFYTGR